MSAKGRNSRSAPSNILNKKIPENPRYKDVKSTLDTGASMSKYMAKIEEIRKNYRYKKDEIFKRMKVTTFVQLVLQVQAYQRKEEQVSRYLESQATNPELTNFRNGGGDSPVPSLALTEGDFGEEGEISTSRSTLQSVIKGIGEFDIDSNSVPATPASAVPNPEESESPYLLLDLRDSDVYDQCHIITAKNYPTAMLSRSVNNFSKDIISYKNKPGKIIVLYDEDERIGPMAATTFVERDFNNTFLLSGGLKLAVQKFPTGLVTGTIPASCRAPLPTQAGKKKPKERPAEPIRPAEHTMFTEEHLDNLLMHLDNCLAPSDTGSRLSRPAPRASSSSTVSSSARSSSSAVHSSHWK